MTNEQVEKAVACAKDRMAAGEHHYWAIRLGLAYALGPEGYAAALADSKGNREFLAPDVYMTIRTRLGIEDDVAFAERVAA